MSELFTGCKTYPLSGVGVTLEGIFHQDSYGLIISHKSIMIFGDLYGYGLPVFKGLLNFGAPDLLIMGVLLFKGLEQFREKLFQLNGL